MNAPPNLTIPILYEHLQAVISWEAVPGASGYQLERRFNAEFEDSAQGITWEEFDRQFTSWINFESRILSWDEFDRMTEDFVIYDGPQTSYTDTIAAGVRTAIYRVRAYDGEGVLSPYETSPMKDVIANRAPVIHLVGGGGTELGVYFRGFSFSILITDPDPQSVIRMTAILDDTTELQNVTNVQQNTPYEIEVSDDLVYAMSDYSVHHIRVTAFDQWGMRTDAEYSFIALEDLTKTAIYYILRDGIPIAKTNRLEFKDYRATGTHQYQIRAVDKYDQFADSNVYQGETVIEYATLAPWNSPQNYIELIKKRGNAPTVQKTLTPDLHFSYIEGNRYPTVSDGGERAAQFSLSFTHQNGADYEKVQQMAEEGDLMLYRDVWGNRFVGHVTGLNDQFISKRLSGLAVDFDLTLTQTENREAIAYD